MKSIETLLKESCVMDSVDTFNMGGGNSNPYINILFESLLLEKKKEKEDDEDLDDIDKDELDEIMSMLDVAQQDDDEDDEKGVINKFRKNKTNESYIREGIFTTFKKAKKRKTATNTVAYLQYQYDHTKDNSQKARIKQNMDFIKTTLYDEDGNTIHSKKQQAKRVASLLRQGAIKKGDIMPRTEMEELAGEAKKFAKSKEGKKYKKEVKKEVRAAWNGLLGRKGRKERKKSREEAERLLNAGEATERRESNSEKRMEITNKKGEKEHVTTFTGPRGGRYYYPKGKSKKPENRVYLNKDGSVREGIAGYLLSRLITE